MPPEPRARALGIPEAIASRAALGSPPRPSAQVLIHGLDTTAVGMIDWEPEDPEVGKETKAMDRRVKRTIAEKGQEFDGEGSNKIEEVTERHGAEDRESDLQKAK
jgi:hypothetical protein